MARRRRSIARGSAGGAASQLNATSVDGCPITAYEEGSGPVTVIIAGGGLDDGRGYARLAARLKSTNRVVRLTRRGYRTDVARWRPVEVKDETADVVALARAVAVRATSLAIPPAVSKHLRPHSPHRSASTHSPSSSRPSTQPSCRL